MLTKQHSFFSTGFKIACLLGGVAFLGAAGFNSSTAHAQSIYVPKEQAASVHIIHVADKSALQTQSENFISKLGQEAISVLAETSGSETARAKKFATLLSRNFDMKTIGRFVLGRYWRTATPEQQKEYLNLFENMVVSAYSTRFSEYSGQELIVHGSRTDSEKDTLVNSAIKFRDGHDKGVNVDWRVRERGDGSLRIVDVIVEGVSMSVTQRSDFSAVIRRGGGNIEVLLDHLRAN